VGYYTRPIASTDITILDEAESDDAGALHRSRGEVRVSTQVTGFKQIKRYTHETIGMGDLDLPAQTFDTSAYWLTLPDNILDALRQAGAWQRDKLDYGPGGLWARQRDAARARDGYRCRNCGAPEPPHRQHDVHHIRPLRLFLAEAKQQGVDPSVVYPQAHSLKNLITLCPGCHRRAELIVQTANAWAGLAHALHNLAPLFLMCDPRDIGVTFESAPAGDSRPTITLYDAIPFGSGFSDRLYDLHDDLLAATRVLVRDCACQSGCPACVGPPPNEGVNLRGETLALVSGF
jgi:DEAD/DEAH box helicase domain-containing protein